MSGTFTVARNTTTTASLSETARTVLPTSRDRRLQMKTFDAGSNRHTD